MTWTPAMERTLENLRARGVGWDEVGARLGCTGRAAYKHAASAGLKTSLANPYIFMTNLDRVGR